MSAQELKERGNAALQKGDAAAAHMLYSRAVELEPNNHILWANRSAAAFSMGEYASALSDARRATTICPSYVKGYTRKGQCLLALGRPHEALLVFFNALTQDPNNTFARTRIEECMTALPHARFKPALDHCLRAVQLRYGGGADARKERWLRAMTPSQRSAILKKGLASSEGSALRLSKARTDEWALTFCDDVTAYSAAVASMRVFETVDNAVEVLSYDICSLPRVGVVDKKALEGLLPVWAMARDWCLRDLPNVVREDDLSLPECAALCCGAFAAFEGALQVQYAKRDGTAGADAGTPQRTAGGANSAKSPTEHSVKSKSSGPHCASCPSFPDVSVKAMKYPGDASDLKRLSPPESADLTDSMVRNTFVKASLDPSLAKTLPMPLLERLCASAQGNPLHGDAVLVCLALANAAEHARELVLSEGVAKALVAFLQDVRPAPLVAQAIANVLGTNAPNVELMARCGAFPAIEKMLSQIDLDGSAANAPGLSVWEHLARGLGNAAVVAWRAARANIVQTGCASLLLSAAKRDGQPVATAAAAHAALVHVMGEQPAVPPSGTGGLDALFDISTSARGRKQLGLGMPWPKEKLTMEDARGEWFMFRPDQKGIVILFSATYIDPLDSWIYVDFLFNCKTSHLRNTVLVLSTEANVRARFDALFAERGMHLRLSEMCHITPEAAVCLVRTAFACTPYELDNNAKQGLELVNALSLRAERPIPSFRTIVDVARASFDVQNIHVGSVLPNPPLHDIFSYEAWRDFTTLMGWNVHTGQFDLAGVPPPPPEIRVRVLDYRSPITPPTRQTIEWIKMAASRLETAEDFLELVVALFRTTAFWAKERNALDLAGALVHNANYVEAILQAVRQKRKPHGSLICSGPVRAMIERGVHCYNLRSRSGEELAGWCRRKGAEAAMYEALFFYGTQCAPKLCPRDPALSAWASAILRELAKWGKRVGGTVMPPESVVCNFIRNTGSAMADVGAETAEDVVQYCGHSIWSMIASVGPEIYEYRPRE